MVKEDNITNKVCVIIGGSCLPFPLSEPDACKSGVSCPVPANTDVTEKQTIQVLKEFPLVSLFHYKLSSVSYIMMKILIFVDNPDRQVGATGCERR